MIDLPHVNFFHLLSLSGPLGTFEHAKGSRARVEHGYCTDDVARALLVSSREREPSDDVTKLAHRSLLFLSKAQGLDGKFVNRRSAAGEWRGPFTDGDCWGRAMWSLGVTIRHSGESQMVAQASTLFSRGALVRSRWPRAMAFATLGATEVLDVNPDHRGARALVGACADLLDRTEPVRGWSWSEDRLTYANAVLPEAMMVAGALAANDRLVDTGLRQLAWLLDLSTSGGHLSVTSAEGRTPAGGESKFDQQPIEVAALFEACSRAYELTGDDRWRKGLELAMEWFFGGNDVGVLMCDPTTGAGFDGLTPYGPNQNQGAESTIAYLATLQRARHPQLAL